jgi:TorA maturation chaperone TorD
MALVDAGADDLFPPRRQRLRWPIAAAQRRSLINALQPAAFESFLNAYLAAFGHAARGSCPLNEIEYGDIKADPLFQPHRLADLAAFYRAFGLEVAEDAGERQDHICLELEFMCVLAAKEAYAHEHQLDSDQLAQCRDAQKKFLREHLGRWTPAFRPPPGRRDERSRAPRARGIHPGLC